MVDRSRRAAKVKPVREVASRYHWPTVYAIVKASSDQIVQAALAKFGVKEPKP